MLAFLALRASRSFTRRVAVIAAGELQPFSRPSVRALSSRPETPMMQQYLSIKRDPQYAGAVVLFQLGNFLEAFFEDAAILSRVLGIALTSRGNASAGEGGGPVPMAGVPLHARDSYISRLVKAGHRVVVVEQEGPQASSSSSSSGSSAASSFKRRSTTASRLETAMKNEGVAKDQSPVQVSIVQAAAGGLMRRRVAEIVTRGTATDDSLLTPRSRNLIAALSFHPSASSASTSSSGSDPDTVVIEAGLAWVDVSTGDFFTARCPSLLSISSELAVNPPVELLVPSFSRSATMLMTTSGASATKEQAGTSTPGPVGIEHLPQLLNKRGAKAEQQQSGALKRDVLLQRIAEAALASSSSSVSPASSSGGGGGGAFVIDLPGTAGSEVEPLTLTLLHGSTFSSARGKVLIAEASSSSSSASAASALSSPELSAAAGLLSYVSWTQQGRMPVLRPPLSLSAADAAPPMAAFSAESNTKQPLLPQQPQQPLPLLERLLACASASSPPRLLIDPSTRRSLEITRPINGRRRARGSLLHTLDLCVTAVGSRLLDQRLCSPVVHSALLNHRLDAVSFLSEASNENLRESLRQCLAAFPDLERSMHRVAMRRGGAPALMRDLLLVRDGLAAAVRVGAMLASGDHVKFSVVSGQAINTSRRRLSAAPALPAGAAVEEEDAAEMATDGSASAKGTDGETAKDSGGSGRKAGFIVSSTFPGFFPDVGGNNNRPTIADGTRSDGKKSPSTVALLTGSDPYERAVGAAIGPLAAVINGWSADKSTTGSAAQFSSMSASALVDLGCRFDFDATIDSGVAFGGKTRAAGGSSKVAESSLVLTLAAAAALLPHHAAVSSAGDRGSSAAAVLRELTAALDPPIPSALATLPGSAPIPASPSLSAAQEAASTAASASGIRIKSGFNADLDAARALRDSANTAMTALQKRLSAATGIRQLKVRLTEEHGCVAEVPAAAAEAIERSTAVATGGGGGASKDDLFPFRRLKTLKATVRFTCPALQQLDRDIRDASFRSDYLESKVLSSLCQNVATAAQEIAAVARAVAVIDVSAGLAEAAKRFSLRRPELEPLPSASASSSFSRRPPPLLELRALRHLVVERSLMQGWVHRMTGQAFASVVPPAEETREEGEDEEKAAGGSDKESDDDNNNHDEDDDDRGFESRELPEDPAPPSAFVPNDCLLGLPADSASDLFSPSRQPSAHVALALGANTAGKSTWLRSAAHAVILAQMGSFVPADRARFALVDKLFARVGASDDVSRGRSTFLVEAEETAHILTSATPASLTLIDEIGRGTSSVDGAAIAFAALEHLAQTVRCRTLFSSHIHEIAAMALLSEVKRKERSGRSGQQEDYSPSIQCLFMEAVGDDDDTAALVSAATNGDGEAAPSIPHLTHRIAPHPLVDFMRQKVTSGASMAEIEEAVWRRVSRISSHGIAVAARAGMPPSVLKRATEISRSLESSSASLSWGKELSRLL